MSFRFATLLILLPMLISSPAAAKDFDCEGTIGDREIDGKLNIAVPCTLNGTTVDGNVEIFAGGSLVARGAEIDGNIKGKRADFVDIRNSWIEGNVDLQEMVGDEIRIRNSIVDGNLKLKENRPHLDIAESVVDGNVEINENSGGVMLVGNTIDGNLKCKDNSPSPEGTGNDVDGKKEGQCRDLGPSESPGPPDNDTGGGDGSDGDGNDADGGGGNDSDGTNGDTGGNGGNPVGGAQPEPFQLNTGTGGGASSGPTFLCLLLMMALMKLGAFRRVAVRLTRSSVAQRDSGILY